MVRTDNIIGPCATPLEKIWVPEEGGREKASQPHCGSLIGRRKEGIEEEEAWLGFPELGLKERKPSEPGSFVWDVQVLYMIWRKTF